MVQRDSHDRRTFLKIAGSTGAAGMAGLAGCTGGGDGGGGDGGGGDGGGGDGDGGGGGDGTTAGGGGDMEPITIGLLEPLSGPIGASGQEASKGAQIAVEKINANGGLNGREIEMKTADTEASPETAVKRARQLIQQEDAEVIIGVVSSAVAKGVNQFTSQQGIPLIVTGSATPDIVKKECAKSTFRVNVNLIHQQRSTIELLKQEYSDLKRVAGVEPDYVYGHQSWEVFKDGFPDAIEGGEIVNETFPAFLKGDYKKEIQATLDADPDLVHSTLYSGDMIAFIKQAKQFDFFDQIDTFIAGVVPMEVTLSLGEAMPDNTIAMANSYFRHPADHQPLKDFNGQYIDRFSQVPTLFSIDTHVAFEALEAAVDKGGSTKTEDVIANLEGLQTDTIKGQLTLRAEDHQGIQDTVPTGPLGPLGEPDLAKLHDKKEIYGFDPVVPISKDKWADEPECSF